MNFSPIKLDHQSLIESYFKEYPQIHSQYSFSTFFTWNQGTFFYEVSEDSDILLMKAINTSNGISFLFKPFLKKHQIVTPRQLWSILKETDCDQYVCVDMSVISDYANTDLDDYFDIQLMNGESDYVYQTSHLAYLEGAKYHKKRNLIQQFNDLHQQNNISFHPLTINDTSHQLALLDEWASHKKSLQNEPDPELDREIQSCHLAITHQKVLRLTSFGLYIDQKLCAFSMGEPQNDQTFVTHYEKYLPDIKGLAQVINQKTALELVNQFKYINRESTGNDQGVTQAKQSYYPDYLVDCYELIPRR